MPLGAKVQPDTVPAYCVPTFVPVNGMSVAAPLLFTVTVLPSM